MKKNIKQLVSIYLTKTFFFAVVIIILIMLLGYREFFKNTIQSKAIEISETVKAGLTAHMKAGIMDKRDYFLKELKGTKNIKSFFIIRGSAIVKQYGISKHNDEKNDVDGTFLKNLKKPLFQWSDAKGTMKAIIPYKATSHGNLNCLKCHDVQENEILGAIEMEMDIKPYQKLTLNYAYVFLLILALFSFLIIRIIYNFINKNIMHPLSSILDDGEEAYKHHKSIDTKKYAVLEIENLANNLNDFNQEVIAKEKALHEKNEELKVLNEEIELTLKDTIMAMGELEERRSRDVRYHTIRVSRLSELIAKAYGCSDEDIKLIKLTSPLHDIGKVGIADNILLKPGKLTKEEFEIMKGHTTMGYDLLKHSKRLILKKAAEIAYTHHEKYDGSGYPRGLKGDEIPLFGQIVAIVDVFDALLCKRVYKEAWSDEEVKEYISSQSGKHFNPELAAIVLKNFKEYSDLIKEFSSKNDLL